MKRTAFSRWAGGKFTGHPHIAHINATNVSWATLNIKLATCTFLPCKEIKGAHAHHEGQRRVRAMGEPCSGTSSFSCNRLASTVIKEVSECRIPIATSFAVKSAPLKLRPVKGAPKPHATTVPPSIGARCRSFRSQKVYTVSLASYKTVFS